MSNAGGSKVSLFIFLRAHTRIQIIKTRGILINRLKSKIFQKTGQLPIPSTTQNLFLNAVKLQ
jgi:hypothetical protein